MYIYNKTNITGRIIMRATDESVIEEIVNRLYDIFDDVETDTIDDTTMFGIERYGAYDADEILQLFRELSAMAPLTYEMSDDAFEDDVPYSLERAWGLSSLTRSERVNMIQRELHCSRDWAEISVPY